MNDMRFALNPLVKIHQESFTLGIKPSSRRSGLCPFEWVKRSFITEISKINILESFTLGIKPNSRRSEICIFEWAKRSFITKISKTNILISPCWNHTLFLFKTSSHCLKC